MTDENKSAKITAIDAQLPNAHIELNNAAFELLDECTEIKTIDGEPIASLCPMRAMAVLILAFQKADEIEYQDRL